MPIKDMLDMIKKRSADAYSSVMSGLRGPAQVSTGTSVVPYDPVQGQRFAPAQQAKAGLRGLSRLGAIGAAGTAAYGGVKTAFDAAREGNTDEDYRLADTPMGKLLTGGPFAALSDSFAHATSPIRAAAIGAGRRFLGNVTGMTAGSQPAQAAPSAAPSASTPQQPEQRKMPPAFAEQSRSSEDDGLIDTLRSGRVTPAALIEGSAVPVEGQGAFQRSGGRAIKVGARSEAIQPGNTRSSGLRAATPFGKMAEGLTRVKAEQIRDSGRLAEANLGIKATTARASAASTISGLRQAQEGRIDRQIEDEVARRIPTGLEKDERTEYVDRQKGELSSRISHSAANRGLDRSDLNERQVRQLMLANRIRNAIEKNWGTLSQGLRDFFGNKRHVSDDLFSYIPEVRGNDIYFGKNKVPISKIIGGGFNLLSPNDPTDQDMMDLIREAIQRAELKKGK